MSTLSNKEQKKKTKNFEADHLFATRWREPIHRSQSKEKSELEFKLCPVVCQRKTYLGRQQLQTGSYAQFWQPTNQTDPFFAPNLDNLRCQTTFSNKSISLNGPRVHIANQTSRHINSSYTPWTAKDI